MDAVTVYFMGGPQDGDLRMIQCDDPMDPPRIQVSQTFSTVDGRVVKHLYERQASQMDTGPGWVYVYKPGEGEWLGEALDDLPDRDRM